MRKKETQRQSSFKKQLGKKFIFFIEFVGINLEKLISIKLFFRYLKDLRNWKRKGGVVHVYHPILEDYNKNAGVASGQYFHQDLLVARKIFKSNPKRHVDIGSRIDGFVAHVASFREIEVFDVRPLKETGHQNIIFKQADLMTNINVGQIDSLSCLHAIEHFGLGRYGDPIDINGHLKGIESIIDVVEVGGTIYISFPIGISNQTHFNAHRIFRPTYILELNKVKDKLSLVGFDYVNDKGELKRDMSPHEMVEEVYNGCGIYTFIKVKSS